MAIFCCVDFVPGAFSEWRNWSGGKSVVEKCCRKASEKSVANRC